MEDDDSELELIEPEDFLPRNPFPSTPSGWASTGGATTPG